MVITLAIISQSKKKEEVFHSIYLFKLIWLGQIKTGSWLWVSVFTLPRSHCSDAAERGLGHAAPDTYHGTSQQFVYFRPGPARLHHIIRREQHMATQIRLREANANLSIHAFRLWSCSLVGFHRTHVTLVFFPRLVFVCSGTRCASWQAKGINDWCYAASWLFLDDLGGRVSFTSIC